jgi:hypothetical protein
MGLSKALIGVVNIEMGLTLGGYGDILYSAINATILLVAILGLLLSTMIKLGLDLLIVLPLIGLGIGRVPASIFLELFVVGLIAFEDIVRLVVGVDGALAVVLGFDGLHFVVSY